MTNAKPIIIALDLAEQHVARHNPIVVQEQQTALRDLLEDNSFAPTSGLIGPFAVRMDVVGNRLQLNVTCQSTQREEAIALPVSPLRGLIKDYFLMCDSYYKALNASQPARLEAIDMGRRGVHNEAAEKLRAMVQDKVTLDIDTARRLFTLVCVLHTRQIQGVGGRD